MIPETTEPSASRADILVSVPPEIRERVTIGPAGSWVQRREVDESFRHAASYSMLLIDQQHHASRGEVYYREVRRLETRQAVHEFGQWRLNFDPGTQKVVIHALAVLRNGNAMEHAQPERLRFLQREGQLEWLVIDGWITVFVVMEDVRMGDLIDMSYTIHTTPRFLKDRAWLLATVPTRIALRAFHLSVRFATGRPMQWKSNEETFAPAVCEWDGETEWSWKKENVPLAVPEPNVPSWHITDTWVQVTDCRSWSEVASGIAAAWQEDFDNPELLKVIEEINASAATTAGRAAQAMTMVQDDIRYLSMNVDLGGQIPSQPGAVLQRRYGDCKDKSFLLAHLLRLLGIKAQPVLVNTFLRQSVDQFLPTPSLFNHAIVKYEIDGAPCWVDATLSLQGGGALGRLVPDFRLGLPVGPDVGDLDPIVQPSTRNDRYELRELFSLDSRPGRSTILETTVTAAGWYAEDLRRSFADAGQDEMARRREQFYRQFYPELQRIETLQWQDDRERNEVMLTEAFDLPNALTSNGDRKTCFIEPRTHLIQSLLGFVEAGRRRHPFILPYPCNVEHRIELETTSILGATRMPKILKKGATFHFSRENTRVGNRSIMTYTLKTLVDFVAADQFEAYKQMVKDLWHHTSYRFTLAFGMPSPRQQKAIDRKSQPASSGKIQSLTKNKKVLPPSRNPVVTLQPRISKRRKEFRVPWRAVLILLATLAAVAVWWYFIFHLGS